MLTFQKYLDPLVNKLGEITDFSDVKMPSTIYEEEYPHLIKTSKVVNKQIGLQMEKLKELEDQLEKQVYVIDNETGDDKKAAVKIYNQILKQIEGTVKRINHEISIIDSPYFGKIKFRRDANAKFPAGNLTAYIGKFAYFDRDSQTNLVTDWRAPIANLYYMNSGPRKGVEFEGPVGTQTGDIEQKRMFEISKARIKNLYDAKTGNSAADEFLLSQLNQKIGQKLTDIVSTIQDEQNKIIRDGINKFTILQGVAGSGKTTIVLHRLAYLFFTHQDTISSDKTLVIAPNKLFLDYISGVLPSLGIDGVETNTYLFWAKKAMKWGNNYVISKQPEDLESKEIKGSKDFLKQLAEGFESYMQEVLENVPYSRADLLYRNYYDIKSKSSSITTSEALKLSLEKIKSDLLIKNLTTGTYMQGISILNEDLETKISKYLTDKTNLFAVYRSIVSNMNIPDRIKKRTLSTVKKNKSVYTYEFEDLAPLTILYFMLNGTTESQKDYVIVDEAQDMSFSQVYSLFMVSKKNNLMLAGDLAQAIKKPNNIKDWIEVFETVKDLTSQETPCEYHQLNKCYRATIETMDYITKRIDPLFPKTFLRPQAVLRHGEKVEIIETERAINSPNSQVDNLLINAIRKELSTNRNTIAIVARTFEFAKDIYDNLKKVKDIAENLVPIETDNYGSGIIVTSVANAKGLEFDSVIIADVNKDSYDNTFEAARQFYVAGTRALHKLYVTYPKGDKSEII